jgi:BirA family biotin operon repressor/biotin-[acetyl-CoA-carboxylase] ligase
MKIWVTIFLLITYFRIHSISEKELKDYLSSLEMKGYPIEYSQEKGYRIIKTPFLFLSYEIQKGLQTKYVGHKIYYYKQVQSTNEVAKELAEKGTPEGTIIITESQSSKRGRWRKKWISP